MVEGETVSALQVGNDMLCLVAHLSIDARQLRVNSHDLTVAITQLVAEFLFPPPQLRLLLAKLCDHPGSHDIRDGLYIAATFEQTARLLETQLFLRDFGPYVCQLLVKLRRLLFGHVDHKPCIAEPALGLYFLNFTFRL